MESLKPLKITGGLALLCLCIFLTIPEARLNAGAALRSAELIKNELVDFQGENVEFLRAYNEVLSNADSKPDVDVIQTRITATELAIESGGLPILAMASRKTSLPGNRALSDPNELAAYLKFLNAAEKLNLAGQKLDPKNAFWPLQLAVLSRDIDAASPYLKKAADCEFYNDFGWEERKIMLTALNYSPSAYEEVMSLAAVMYPNLAYYRSICQEYTQSESLAPSIEIRITVAKIGKILATRSDIYITTLVGRAIIRQSIQKPKIEGVNPTPKYSLKELNAAVATSSVETGDIFRAALQMSNDTKAITFPEIEGWQIIEHFGSSFLSLPFLVFGIFALAPLVILGTQKIADRPWIKSIRYLAILPLSLCFVFNSNGANFHSGTMVIILLVSIPVALISFTEKFIPVIHITTVVLTFNTFYRGDNFDNLAIETGAIAILTLIAWGKNRKPEKIASKWASHILLLLAFCAIGIWAFRQFGSGLLPMPTYFNLGLVLLSFLAISDSDKMQARKQATYAAAIGLALFAASAIVSLDVTKKIRNTVSEELQFIQGQQLKNLSYFEDPSSATKRNNPGVKPIK